jgi:acyl carrier protein
LGLLDRIKTMLGTDEDSAKDSAEDSAEDNAHDNSEAATPASKPGPVSSASAADIAQVLLEHVANGSQGEFSPEDIPSDAGLFDEAFIDSISSIKFLDFISDRYGVDIDEVELVGRLGSVDALVQHILAARQTQAWP